MKILIVGDWHSDIHEEPLLHAFQSLGHDVYSFAWHSYFQSKNILTRIEAKYLIGSKILLLNKKFLQDVEKIQPDLIFIYRGSHIFSSTLMALKRQMPRVIVVGYNNDDPFSERAPRFYWRHFIAGIPHYDLVFAYRIHNLADFQKAGAKRTELLRSWYIPRLNRPIAVDDEMEKKYSSDVTLIAHYEADGRESLVEEIIKNGIRFRLFGPDWPAHILQGSSELRRLPPVVPVRGEEYNKAICSTNIALCILSKLNRDTYTRRCFEIPAAGKFMLAEYTPDLASLYKEGKECEFFRSKGELIDKIRFYLKNVELREKIAQAGYQRVIEDGHDVVSRAKAILEAVGRIGIT